jgi:hypothetical protein
LVVIPGIKCTIRIDIVIVSGYDGWFHVHPFVVIFGTVGEKPSDRPFRRDVAGMNSTSHGEALVVKKRVQELKAKPLRKNNEEFSR